MTLAGYLSEYSLAEIFNFVHEGNHTGALTIFPDRYSNEFSTDPSYLWFDSGRIVAVTSGLNGKELLTKIAQRKLMTPVQIESLETQFHQLPQPMGLYLQSRGLFDIDLVGTELESIPQPLGIYLKSRGLLDAEQLKLLFNSQTIVTVCKLFELQNRQFRFDPNKLPLNAEMTGLSIPAQELGLLALRALKDWSGFSSKLPDPDYVIQKCSERQPSVRLDRNELHLWKLADGVKTLTKLAIKMQVSIEVVQQISFRLSSFRLVQEIPSKPPESIDPDLAVSVIAPGYKNAPVSNSFLNNLKGFLKKGNNKSTKSLTR